MVDFDVTLGRHGLGPLRRERPITLQVNVGKRCNQACHHCHVDAGPKRTEMMSATTAARVLDLLASNPGVEVLDLTGGAPELNPNFATLVTAARALGRRVIVRCNLTVLLVDGMAELPAFYRRHAVEIVASLPCYTADNVDRQRGGGVFADSVEALRRLNAVGYGLPGSALRLDLVYNPVGAFLPPAQALLESQYRDTLARDHGIRFHRLLTITNMPINRFAEQLSRTGAREAYAALLVEHFNPDTVPSLMCRHLVSVGWDGRLYDCDFNQMLELPLGGAARTIWDVDDLSTLAGERVATAAHCFGCTAGAGSSCGGSLAGDGPAGAAA
jgi:radical SAM/Cys-rich protein